MSLPRLQTDSVISTSWRAIPGAFQLVLKFIGGFEAVTIAVAKSGELEQFEILFGGIDLAGEVALFNVKPE